MKNQANEIDQAILTVDGSFVPQTSIFKLIDLDMYSEEKKEKRIEFDTIITKIHGDSIMLQEDYAGT